MINVVKGGQQILINLSKEEKELVKKDLTLDNPAYAQVKKFSRYAFTRVEPYINFYTKFDKDLIVPRGYEIPFKHKIIKDDRILAPTLYPKFKLQLREAQKEAYEAWRTNTERGMIVLQTGKGKSILGCYLAYASRQRTLIIVQKNDLIDGWMDDFALCFGLEKGKKVGLIKAQKFKIGSQITLATIQTLSSLPEEKLRLLYNTFGMIICDEVHHSPAKSYEILKYFQAKFFIGLTATDNRGDGLRDVQYWMFGNVCYRSEDKADDEDIMPYSVKIKTSALKYEPPDEFYYGRKVISKEEADELPKKEKKKLKRKTVDPQVLKALLKDEGFTRQVAKDIISEYRQNKSCIAFIHEKEHIRMMRDTLVSYGVPTEQIILYYGDSKEKDSEMKRRAESRESLITLTSYSKGTEGTNVKAWERGFLVTSLNNEQGVEQATGRCRRRKQGKEDVIIYTYSHPNVKGMRSHINTQIRVFKKNKAVIIGSTKSKNKNKVIRGWRGFRNR